MESSVVTSRFLSAELLGRSPLLAPVAPIVRAHHERVDGAGYPDGLREAGIPCEARLVSEATASPLQGAMDAAA